VITSSRQHKDLIMQKQPNYLIRFVVLVFYIAVCAAVGASVVAHNFATAFWIGLWFAFMASIVIAAMWLISFAFRGNRSSKFPHR